MNLLKLLSVFLSDNIYYINGSDSLIRQAFREFIPETTKLIIAQRISSVQDADMIVMLENGMVAAVGNHDELMASSPIYQEVYYSQQKGGDE